MFGPTFPCICEAMSPRDMGEGFGGFRRSMLAHEVSFGCRIVVLDALLLPFLWMKDPRCGDGGGGALYVIGNCACH